MEVTVNNSEGLNRELKIVIPATQTTEKIEKYLNDLNKKIDVKGFRRGKVPLAMLKKIFGRQAVGEILGDLINDVTKKVVEDREEQITVPAEVELADNAVDAILSNQDLSYVMKYEIVPEIKMIDLAKIHVERPTVPEDEAFVENYIKELAEQSRSYESRSNDDPSKIGDQLEVKYLEKSEDGSNTAVDSESFKLVLGSPHIFSSDESKLVGIKVGEVRELNVSLPSGSVTQNEENKNLTVEVTILDVAKPKEIKIDDDFAKNYGLESLEKLKESVRSQSNNNFSELANSIVVGRIHEKLIEMCEFPTPKKVVKVEFDKMWEDHVAQLNGKSDAAEVSDDVELQQKNDMEESAERKVRLHFVMQEIAKKNGIKVSDSAMEARMNQFANMASGGRADANIINEIKTNDQLVRQLYANEWVKQVNEFLLSKVETVDKKVTKEELSLLGQKYQTLFA